MDNTTALPVSDDSANEWLASSDSAETDAVETGSASDKRNWGPTVGLLAAGALVGGIAVAGLQASATPSQPTATVNTTGQGQGQGPGPGAGGLGARTGERPINGTLDAVGPSSITVSSAAGTATYVVNGDTQIVRNGSVVPLSALQVGDPVFVHVYPSGSSMLAERIFVGTMPGRGGPVPGQQQQGTTTQT